MYRTFRSYSSAVVMLAAVAIGLFGCARAGAANRALLIGITQYGHFNDSGLFGDLDCGEDIHRIKAALVSTFKFSADPKAGEITELTTPDQTKRASLIAAFEKLIASTHDGDIVYIHYSGHGAQVPDPSAPGGVDDAIVPADYNDDLTNLITGKQLAAILKRLKDADGSGQVTLSFDCCHSATITRGTAKKRGMAWSEYATWMQNHRHLSRVLPPGAKSRGDTTAIANLAMRDLTVPGIVVISACANDMSAWETTDEAGVTLGRLSLVLAKALTKATPHTTYAQLYDSIKASFAQNYPDQTPQIDGDGNAYLLGGQAPEPASSQLVFLRSPGHYAIDAGKLQGVTAGSTFAIYDKAATTFDDATKIATAKVDAVTLTDADISLTQKVKPDIGDDAMTASHAVEISHNYGKYQLTVDAPGLRKLLPSAADKILAATSAAGLVSGDVPAGHAPDIRFVSATATGAAARGPASITLVRGDTGSPIRDVSTADDVANQMTSDLTQLAKYHYAMTVLSRDDPGGAVRVQMSLQPANVVVGDDGGVTWKGDLEGNGTSFKVGDYFTVQVKNPSRMDLFVTVLDIDSNGDIGQAWPSPRHTVQDNVIPGGTTNWVTLWNGSDTTSKHVFHAKSADPDEIYKLIATDSYVCYKALCDRDINARGTGPFDALIGPAAGKGKRDGGSIEAPTSWATFDAEFKILP